MKQTILITGVAGFIGFHLTKSLLDEQYEIIGFDNINNYYDVNLKYARLEILNKYNNFKFVQADLADENSVNDVFKTYKPDIAVNLAAQAGVRYSIENPKAYIDSNIIGFFNVLEACRHYPVKHLIMRQVHLYMAIRKKRRFQ